MNTKIISNLLRKFALASKPAVYTMKTAPSKVKLDKVKDILHMHWNDSPQGERISNGVSSAIQKFNKADHGIVARLGADTTEYNYGLSHDSAPLFLSLGTRWAKQGKARFVEIQGEPAMVRLNTIPQKGTTSKPNWTQEYVDKLYDKIKTINELQGTSYPLPRLVQK